METNTTASAASDRAQAELFLASAFAEIMMSQGGDLERMEDACVAAGHELMAAAFGLALERLDGALRSRLAQDVRPHDRRSRTIATKMGDVRFSYRRFRDAYGNTVVPLADALDFPWYARISPAARSFLVAAGADVSFSKSAGLLGMAGGSHVSAVSVMRCVHRAGELCADEDAAAAKSLVGDGVVPDAECEASEICVESDGTYFKLQGPDGGSVEVKAMVAYAGKLEKGGKVLRAKAVRHGCATRAPREFWEESTAAVGTRFDLSKVKLAHMGSDGEAQYLSGFLRCGCDEVHSIDPFHVNRKVRSCFGREDRKLADNILGVVIDGDAAAAADLVELAGKLGIAKKNYADVASFLRDNAEAIYRPGAASLGTMEAEQQHVYGARMDSVPCGWSVAGADAMARVRSRMASGRELPRLTRELSVTPRRRRRAEAREMRALASMVDTRVPLKVGKGRGAEHVSSVACMSAQVRYAAGIDSGMVATGW